jgi:23S rRNA (uracil1939-C5)-methyltransferase
MVRHACSCWNRQDDRVLDLFCGLAISRSICAGGTVVGVEWDAQLVEKARQNAARNGLANAEFYLADLTGDMSGAAWLRQTWDRILIDPPRSGAQEMLHHLAATKAQRLVYVSCHPASLARDAGILVHELGFTLAAAGVMDMFPHTAHVESIAVFERSR